jgi:ABC-type Zn uptake system ZnuABC Zn-binding protein ZnuA
MRSRKVGGVLDLRAILTQAKKSGVQHFFVERDLAPNPDETLRKSYQYLSALEHKN